MSFFITIEGMDGSGKGTQIQMIKEKWPEFVYVRDPGSTPVGENIRELIFKNDMFSLTESLLYAAARAEMIADIILPAMDSGKNVISDRFLDSNIAYQGFGRGLGFSTIYDIHMASCKLIPDLTIFLDIPPELSLQRVSGDDRIERESIEFHKEVYKGYLWLADTMKGRFVKVDATGNPNQIFAKVSKLISEVVQKRREL